MRRTGAALVLCAALLVPAARAEVPFPIERPKPKVEFRAQTAAATEEIEGNAPDTRTESLARIKAEIERQRKERERITRERAATERDSADIQERSIRLAEEVQKKELAVTLSEDNLDVLSQRETEILAKLKVDRGRITDTIAALELLERHRPPALAVRPEDAADAVRSAILLSDIVPRLRADADALARELDDLRLVRKRITDEHTTLESAVQSLRDEKAQLEALMSEQAQFRVALGEEDVARQAELEALGRRAESLTALLEGLGQDTGGAPTPVPRPGTGQIAMRVPSPAVPGKVEGGVWSSPGSLPKSFAEARGQLRMPAVGKVVEEFGVPNESGGTTKGIKIGTRAGAQVIAPFDGRVKYAGALKTYGHVLIVEAGDDYLIVLAGLARIDTSVGQWLLAGEPVGRMAETGEEGPSELYVEFRRAKEPFDPTPWLAGVTKEG